MCNSSPAFIAAVIPILLLMVSCANLEGGIPPEGFASPVEVFDAYRESRIKRDWGRLYSYLTPEVQNDLVFESYFECGMRDSKESNAILRKYGLDDSRLTEPIRRTYKEKYGIDIATPDEDSLDDGTRTPPSLDREAMVEIVSGQVKDKARFIGAVVELSKNIPVSPLGELEELDIDGDTATGRAKMTLVRTPGESPTIIDKKIDKTFHFRKVDGGWLLNSL